MILLIQHKVPVLISSDPPVADKYSVLTDIVTQPALTVVSPSSNIPFKLAYQRQLGGRDPFTNGTEDARKLEDARNLIDDAEDATLLGDFSDKLVSVF